MRIIFVCQGNIIRSPLAENVFRHLARERGVLDNYHLDSAGTSAYHVGESPDHRMRQLAGEKGLHYSGQAKQFSREDYDRFDLIVAMDRDNQRYLQLNAASEMDLKKVRLMRDFDPESGSDLDVPDPYYGGLAGFSITFDIVKRSCQGLLEALESEKSTL